MQKILMAENLVLSLTECGFRDSFDGCTERLEQYERKGRLTLQEVSGLSGLNSYKTSLYINSN